MAELVFGVQSFGKGSIMRITVQVSRVSLTAAAIMLCAMWISASPLHAQAVNTSIPPIEWQRCFGASSDDYLFSIIQTRDGGYIACGLTKSDTLPRKHGEGEDAYVVKLDASGN